MNPVIDCLQNHRSVRKFTPQTVEPEMVELLLRTGTRAATAGNLQHYSFLIVDDPEKKAALGADLVPLVVIALADLYRIRRWFEANDAGPVVNNRANNLLIGLWDALIALHNVQVAAESLGLGTVYMGGILSADIQSLFGTPETVFPAGMLFIGYPEVTPERSSRLPLEAVVHTNCYRSPTDEELCAWYKERESPWETVSESLKAEFAQQGIYSIPQFVAKRKFTHEAATERSRGIIENLHKAGFVLDPE